MQPVSLTVGNQEFIAPVAIYLLAKSAGSNINFTTYELPFITKKYMLVVGPNTLISAKQQSGMARYPR